MLCTLLTIVSTSVCPSPWVAPAFVVMSTFVHMPICFSPSFALALFVTSTIVHCPILCQPMYCSAMACPCMTCLAETVMFLFGLTCRIWHLCNLCLVRQTDCFVCTHTCPAQKHWIFMIVHDVELRCATFPRYGTYHRCYCYIFSSLGATQAVWLMAWHDTMISNGMAWTMLDNRLIDASYDWTWSGIWSATFHKCWSTPTNESKGYSHVGADVDMIQHKRAPLACARLRSTLCPHRNVSSFASQ